MLGPGHSWHISGLPNNVSDPIFVLSHQICAWVQKLIVSVDARTSPEYLNTWNWLNTMDARGDQPVFIPSSRTPSYQPGLTFLLSKMFCGMKNESLPNVLRIILQALDSWSHLVTWLLPALLSLSIFFGVVLFAGRRILHVRFLEYLLGLLAFHEVGQWAMLFGKEEIGILVYNRV